MIGKALIGLVEVLGGEQDRGALRDDGAHDLPDLVAAARVESGGRLVEEEQVWGVEDGSRDVDAPPHTARVLLDLPAGRRGEPEGFQELGGTLPGRRPGVPEQPGQQHQVLGTGQVLVHGRVLAGETDPAAHGVRVAGDVLAEDPCLPAVRPQQRGQHLHHGGLAGTVGAEHAVDGPLRDRQVDPVDGPVVAEDLDEADRFDGVAGVMRGTQSSRV